MAHHVSFTAYGGEILGIAGISGCGQKELLEAIAGLQPSEPGAFIDYYAPDGEQRSLVGRSPREIASYGVHLSFVPEDRLGMVSFASSFLEGGVGVTEEDAEEKLTGIRIGFDQRKQLELKTIVPYIIFTHLLDRGPAERGHPG